MKNKKDSWWFRLMKVIYIASYVSALIVVLYIILILFLIEGEPDVLPLIPLILFLSVLLLKLFKIIFLYVVFAEKPQWKGEFKIVGAGGFLILMIVVMGSVIFLTERNLRGGGQDLSFAPQSGGSSGSSTLSGLSDLDDLLDFSELDELLDL